MPFDVNAARQSGYSDGEIANFLAMQNPKFDMGAARNAGYSDAEIVDHLTQQPPKPPEKPAPEKGVLESAALGGGSSIAKRGIGLMQTAEDLGIPVHKAFNLLPGVNLDEKSFREATNKAVQNENKAAEGTGVTGFVTGALADPVNLMVPGGTGVGALAKYGAVSGLTGGQENDKGIAARGLQAAIEAPAAVIGGKTLQMAAKPVSYLADKVGLNDAAAKLAEKFPDMASLLGSSAPSAAKQVAKDTNLNILAKANKGNAFADAPNALDAGLQANQKISEAFNNVNEQASKLYAARDALGQGKFAPDRGIKDAIDVTIAKLEKDPAITLDPKKNALLNKLNQVKDSFDAGVPSTILTASGQPMQGKMQGQIPFSALTDLDEALSSVFKGNKFPDAATHNASKLKQLVANELDNLKTTGVDGGFVDAHNAAKDFYKNEVAKKFLSNDELKPLWQPEDYYSWKAAQSNPNAQPYTTGTISRASTLLDNLNAKDNAGRVASVTQALPANEAENVLRNAIRNANAQNPSLGGAVAQLASLHPVTAAKSLAKIGIKNAMGQGGASPLQKLAEQVTPSAVSDAINTGAGYAGSRAVGQLGNKFTGKQEQVQQPQQQIPATNPPSQASNDPISNAAQATGMSPQLLQIIAQRESGGNPNARAKTSSAKGLFQFTTATWNDMVKKYGADYGITKAGIFDPNQNAMAAALFAKDNAQYLTDKIGRSPTDAEIYMAHFLGAKGAAKLLNSTGMENAAALFPQAAQANRSIFYDGMRPRTTAQLYQTIANKI